MARSSSWEGAVGTVRLARRDDDGIDGAVATVLGRVTRRLRRACPDALAAYRSSVGNREGLLRGTLLRVEARGGVHLVHAHELDDVGFPVRRRWRGRRAVDDAWPAVSPSEVGLSYRLQQEPAHALVTRAAAVLPGDVPTRTQLSVALALAVDGGCTGGILELPLDRYGRVVRPPATAKRVATIGCERASLGAAQIPHVDGLRGTGVRVRFAPDDPGRQVTAFVVRPGAAQATARFLLVDLVA